MTYREHSIHLTVESVLLIVLSGYMCLPVVLIPCAFTFCFVVLGTHQPVFRTVTVQSLHEQQEVFTVVSISVVHAYDVFCNTGGFNVEITKKVS